MSGWLKRMSGWLGRISGWLLVLLGLDWLVGYQVGWGGCRDSLGVCWIVRLGCQVGWGGCQIGWRGSQVVRG